MTHRTIVYVASVEFLLCVIEFEMTLTADDIHNLRIHLMLMVATVGTWLQTTHHNLVLLVDEVAGIEFSIATLEILKLLLLNFAIVYNLDNILKILIAELTFPFFNTVN